MSVAVQITPSFDAIAAFSDAVGLIYESRLDPGRIGDATLAIERLLGADEVTVCCGTPEIGSDFQKRTNGRTLYLDIPASDGGGARLQVRRGPSKPPFSDDDVFLLSLLRPHLQRAEWLGVLMPHGVLGTLAGDTFVRFMNQGLIVADVNGIIRWRNPAAAEMLLRGEGLSILDGRLRASRSFETATLFELLRSAADGRRGVMLIGRGAGKHPIGFVVTRIEHYETGAADGAPLLLLVIKEIEREIGTLAGRLGELFGLTAAEERLAILLLNGHTLQSAAEASHKTLATVKTQLRNLLRKTGARGQSDLMNVLLSLPSLI